MQPANQRTVRLIVNGKAAGDSALRHAVHQVREEGTRIEVRVTWEAGDAARLVDEAVRDGVDVIAAAGGDGTVGEIVNGLMRLPNPAAAAVAVIPYGTANDFATGCGIAKGDPLSALRLAAHGEARAIDVGRANDRYFINVASGGFGARVTAETPTQMKKVLGGAAYSLVGLVTAAKMTPYHGRLIAPTGEAVGDMLLMAVGNGRLAGGGYAVAPLARLDDGLLDVMVVLNSELSDVGVVLNELMSPTAKDNRFVVYRQLAAFRVETDVPLHVNLDGEPMLAAAIDFAVVPRAARFILPEHAPLA